MENIIINLPESSLILLIGTSGSGKSTFAKKHFKETEIISSDHCRAIVCDDFTDQSATMDAFNLLNFILDKRLKNGKLTVIDATNLKRKYRNQLLQLSAKYNIPSIAIILNLPIEVCLERNKQTPHKKVSDEVILKHNIQLKETLNNVKEEGFYRIIELNSIEEINDIVINKETPFFNIKTENNLFDIIGDVHGCFDELYNLLIKLNYNISYNGNNFVITHPEHRKLIFVGDLVDRGPKSDKVLELVMDIVKSNIGYSVIGNHDDKLKRKLQGRPVQINHGLDLTLEQLSDKSEEYIKNVFNFLNSTLSHLIFDNGKLVVSHAGILEGYIGLNSNKIKNFCLYGQVNGKLDEFGLPIREKWAGNYNGEALIVFGHTPVSEVERLNNTINIDTGCVFGGKLTALRYPELDFVSVDAEKIYCEFARPIINS